jgi:hypothetical protein
MSPSPPRGMTQWMNESSPRRTSSAARSVVGTSCTESRGSPAAASDSETSEARALLVSKISRPPRRIEALPLFRQSTAQSMVTFGRASKMTAITPIGTRTLRSRRPLGRVDSSRTSPSGSGRAATWRTDSARCVSLSGVSVRRSTCAGVSAPASAAARSSLFAAPRAPWERSILPARSVSAAFRACVGETASASEAARARTAMAVTSVARSSGMGSRGLSPRPGPSAKEFWPGVPRGGVSRKSGPC